jgi:hypothetical protein
MAQRSEEVEPRLLANICVEQPKPTVCAGGRHCVWLKSLFGGTKFG